jgi:hypothetical protein
MGQEAAARHLHKCLGRAGEVSRCETEPRVTDAEEGSREQ